MCDPEGLYCVARTPGPEEASTSDVEGGGGDVADVDAAPEPRCDGRAKFETIGLVRGLETLAVSSARLMSDETTVLFSAWKDCALESCADLFVATRADKRSPFTVKEGSLAVSSKSASDYWPTMTTDGLLLFFESSRDPEDPKAIDHARIWSASRANKYDEFSDEKVPTMFDVDAIEGSPYLHPNGHTLYFVSDGRGGLGAYDLFVAELVDIDRPQLVRNLSTVNTTDFEVHPVVTLDHTTLYFAREMKSVRHIFRSTRASTTADFGDVEPVTELNTTGKLEDFPSWISDDECRLYFVSNRPADGADGGPGPFHLWMAERSLTK